MSAARVAVMRDRESARPGGAGSAKAPVVLSQDGQLRTGDPQPQPPSVRSLALARAQESGRLERMQAQLPRCGGLVGSGWLGRLSAVPPAPGARRHRHSSPSVRLALLSKKDMDSWAWILLVRTSGLQ
jgi:hypothetical protein